MTTFYPNPDRFLWPVIVDSSNDEVSVTEDPNGTPTTITATLTHSDQLSNDAIYYCFGTNATTDGTNNGDLKIVDSSQETVHVRGLYEEVASVLTAESSNSGNSLSYEIEAIQPSGADHANIGLRLTTSAASTEIQWNFSTPNHIDPRFFGWSADGTDNSGSAPTAGTVQNGPFSRWGVWYSAQPMYGLNGQSAGKRAAHEHRTFGSSPHGRRRKLWQWTQREIMRPMEWYVGVAGVHIHPFDRAERSAESDRGGLADGDSNNALKFMWDNCRFGDDLVIVGHGQGESELGNIISKSSGSADTTEHFETGRIDQKWLQRWAPHENQQFDHGGEKYDVRVPYFANDPDDAATSGYRH